MESDSPPDDLSQVVVRRTEPDDAEAVAATMAGPRAVWGTMQLPFPSTAEWRQRLENNPDGLWPLVACVGGFDGEVVGTLALISESRPRRRHVASLGMAVRDDWQGRGVGTALVAAAVDLADNWVQVGRLELDVYPDNVPALRLYRAFGFEDEGVARKAVFRGGEYVDLVRMSRLHPRLQGASVKDSPNASG